MKQRTNSTENTKYLFNNHERSSLNRNAAGGNNQLTFHSSKLKNFSWFLKVVKQILNSLFSLGNHRELKYQGVRTIRTWYRKI